MPRFAKLNQPLILTKESRSWSAIMSMGYRGPQWMTGNYEAYAREGYTYNSTAYACINATVRALRGVQFVVYRASGSGYRPVPKGPLVDLIRRPNARQSWSSLVGEWAGAMELSGNAYIEGVGPDSRANWIKNPPKELWVLRPDRMFVIPGNERVPIAGFEYRAGALPVPYPVQLWRNPSTEAVEARLPVLHSKYWNPCVEDGDWYGLSPIKAAARYIDAFNTAVSWNVGLTQNVARPSGIFTTEDQTLTSQQAEEYTNLIRQKFSGPANAGRPMVLGKGLTWQQIGLSPIDMAWLEGLEWNSLQICAIYGIPPEIIGNTTRRTYENFNEARRSVWMEKWLNMLDMLCEDLNNWLTPLYSQMMGEEISIGYDRDGIEAIQEDRQIKWRNAKDGAGYLRVNEQRSLLGYEPLTPAEGGEDVLVPVGMVPLRVSAAQEQMPTVAAALENNNTSGQPSGSSSNGPGNKPQSPKIPNRPNPSRLQARPGGGKPTAKPSKKGEDILDAEVVDVNEEVLTKIQATRQRLRALMP